MENPASKFDFVSIAVIVANPTDETLWPGGLLLMHSDCLWKVISLCGKNDNDKSAKFFKALDVLGATGEMADFDPDSPKPIPEYKVEEAILSLLPGDRFDLIITHNIWGEYATASPRNKEIGKTVLALCKTKQLIAKEVWMFSYDDGGGKFLPKPTKNADISAWLPDEIWRRKHEIITNIYGFPADSFQSKVVPRQETFWRFEAGKTAVRPEIKPDMPLKPVVPEKPQPVQKPVSRLAQLTARDSRLNPDFRKNNGKK